MPPTWGGKVLLFVDSAFGAGVAVFFWYIFLSDLIQRLLKRGDQNNSQ